MILARGHIELDNDAIIKHCYNFLDEHKLNDYDKEWGQLGSRLSSVAMVMYLRKNKLDHLMPHFWPEFKSLVDQIENTIGKKIKISWFNILTPGTNLSEHTHINGRARGMVYGSVVYYPKLDADDATLEIFENDEWKAVPAITGDWVSFGLECLHQVPTNNTDRHRISFSFDL
jgi:hypothetical protein